MCGILRVTSRHPPPAALMEQASEAAFGPILLSTMAGVATGLGGALTWCVPRQVPPQQVRLGGGAHSAA